jgi:hypothetical protein
MRFQSVLLICVVSLCVVSCASAPPHPVRSEFEDIPVPRGMAYQADDSTVIETPVVKAGRQVYRGRIEVDSLATAIRTTLESNGWRPVSNTSNARRGTTQVYEKGGTSLQVLLWEGLWFTYAEYTTARVLQLSK